jgi:hypothetical protein
MRHCLLYHGSFERNFALLQPGAKTFVGTDGSEHPLPAVPREVDGVVISYMERGGKKFAAVRVQHGKMDVVAGHDLLLDSRRHLSLGTRFSPEPIIITDEFAAVIIEDLMAKNPEQRNEFAAVRSAFSRTAKAKPRK